MGLKLPDQSRAHAAGTLGWKPGMGGVGQHVFLDRPDCAGDGRVSDADPAVFRSEGDRAVPGLRNGGVPGDVSARIRTKVISRKGSPLVPMLYLPEWTSPQRGEAMAIRDILFRKSPKGK